jgi:DNA-binding winged helix-turn-helix (wHTH) protein/TolB-like protein/tetratricopeptide (TPR) repeat protein
MGSAVSSGPVYRFGLFEADVANNTLTRKGVRVKIQDQPFHVLILLLQKPGEIVTREELRQALWPEGTYVDFDGSLNVIVKKLRTAIDDDSENPRFIETVPRRGYRFIAPISVDQAETFSQTAKSEGEFWSSTVVSSTAPTARQKVKPWMKPALVGLILVFAASAWWYFLRYHSVVHASPRIIAVLPFANEGAGPDFDFLRYAIANDLTYARSISVRPFASTSKYAAQPTDPADVGKELHVTHVVTGGFLIDQQQLRVNLELVDVAKNQVVWREEVTLAPQELIGLHKKLAASATQRLLPAMNVGAISADNMPVPRNEQAFSLFLHSFMIPLDPGPNQDAIRTLEHSVALDSAYAPAWGQLSWRYYIDYHYANGGEAARIKSDQAFKRESELDPSTPPISTTIRAEQGDLQGAYDQAAEFLRSRPDLSMAHFWMGYVLRYAGLLDEAGKECDAGFVLDPGFNVLRSCATTFILAGDYAHAQRYIKVDEGSGFGALLRMDIALRERKTATVLAEANTASRLGYRRVYAKLAQACLNPAPEGNLAKVVAEVEGDPVSSHDPELLYQNAGVLSLCGQSDAALRQLRNAIKGNYCSYPALDNDPQFDSIRQRPEFAELRQAAIQCQQNFLIHRKR